jgi:DNA-binding CsgD family transcriptional regulator
LTSQYFCAYKDGQDRRPGLRSSRAGDNRHVLDLVTAILERAGPAFPDVTVTALLREVFQADFCSAGKIAFAGGDSRRWADSPRPVPASQADFQRYAVSHPIVRAYIRTRDPAPLRMSDVSAVPVTTPAEWGGMSRVLAIPLAIGERDVHGIGLMRAGPDFTALDLRLAAGLQPVFGAIYALCDRIADRVGEGNAIRADHASDPDTGIPISSRELAVLDLMADGLITAAIARRLGISQRTVSKHVEGIYRKLGTHDRTSAVLRGQALGLIPVAARTANAQPSHGPPHDHP